MTLARRRTLCAAAAEIGCALNDEQADALLAYLDAMLDENRSVNLTAVRDPDRALVLHATDSLAVALALAGTAPESCLDLGTGNGFPGVAVKVLCPDARVVLLDRTRKKLDAVRRALERARIGGVETLHADACQARAAGLEGHFELVTARAVGAPELVAQLAAPLLAAGGHLCLWRTAGEGMARELPGGLRLESVSDYELPAPEARSRRLVCYSAPA